jgi:hypothetical protein
MSQEIIENAKAVQEASKAVSKVAETSEKLGSFIAKYTHESIAAGMGIFSDKLKYMRWVRQHRFMKRATQFLELEGLSEPIFAFPLKSAIPLLEAASLEEDDDLQDLFAKLLVVASTDESRNKTFLRSYVDTLERFTPLMAKIFDSSYTNYYITYESFSRGVDINKTLPEDLSNAMILGSFDLENELAWNELDRLGCLRVERNQSDGKLQLNSKVTRYGLALFDAIKLKSLDNQK